MTRKPIPANISRQLWANSGGYCQRPDCNKYLLASIGTEKVSLANMAHIIGHGKNGPRSEHDLANIIDRDGLNNLLMLCLDCHKIVDELERQFSVETMHSWKNKHEKELQSLFLTPNITDEQELLMQVNDFLDINDTIFKEYGPYSKNILEGQSGDGIKVWRKRCLDTILPNNQKIINIIEKNKRNFSYPWDVYRQMLLYKIHTDAFQDNCLSGEKINDYKLFPLEFDHFIKTKLGFKLPPIEKRQSEELEYRSNQVSTFIDRFLSNHEKIKHMEELNRATMLIDLYDGRTLKVFVTNTYIFTEYTFEKIMAIDPSINAIICSCPYNGYTYPAKELCINNDIGLFMLGEFMGAIRKQGQDYLNYLLKSDKEERLNIIKTVIKNINLPRDLRVYVFGSYIRRKIYNDIDLMLVYSNFDSKKYINKVEQNLKNEFKNDTIDFTVASESEFKTIKLQHDNLTLV